MPKRTKAKQAPRGGAEYRFKIDAYTPDTMPMARLAEYMAELSQLLGEAAAVHFRRLEPGSTVVVHKIDREAVPKVRARATSVRRGDAPQDAMRAFKTLNKLLREDNAVGALQDKRGKTNAIILRFPGRLETVEKFAAIRQQGSIDGIINRIGGRDETVHVGLESEDKQISGCYTTRGIAKELRHLLFEPVRLYGRGRWNRDDDGNWTLEEFKIESFEALKDAPLSTALAELRDMPTDWVEGAYKELKKIRHGEPRKKHGGH
jgi:hypothetical protein